MFDFDFVTLPRAHRQIHDLVSMDGDFSWCRVLAECSVGDYPLKIMPSLLGVVVHAFNFSP